MKTFIEEYGGMLVIIIMGAGLIGSLAWILNQIMI
jgi:hypothetical protein